jgi:molybdate transport system ATP-binding protein
VYLKNGSAGYEGKPIFTDLNLKIHTGDHTLVTGPNGCGKSTLLQLITGDHPACYQNDLRIFGIQRGTGESIWELKKKMGIVSPDLHRNYFVPGTALHCIISGLFDSIGLYQKYTRQDEHQAQKWLERTGLIREAHTPFRQLGYASQRLVLIARALIKMPRLLILDEPTQGLDELNRKAVLDFLEQVAREKLSTLLYVSHRQDEFRPFFKYRIQL